MIERFKNFLRPSSNRAERRATRAFIQQEHRAENDVDVQRAMLDSFKLARQTSRPAETDAQMARRLDSENRANIAGLERLGFRNASSGSVASRTTTSSRSSMSDRPKEAEAAKKLRLKAEEEATRRLLESEGLLSPVASTSQRRTPFSTSRSPVRRNSYQTVVSPVAPLAKDVEIFQGGDGMSCYVTTPFLSVRNQKNAQRMMDNVAPKAPDELFVIKNGQRIALSRVDIQNTQENIETNSPQIRKIIAAHKKNSDLTQDGSAIQFLKAFFGEGQVKVIEASEPGLFDNTKALKQLQAPEHQGKNSVDVILAHRAAGGIPQNTEGHYLAVERLASGEYKVTNPLRRNNHRDFDIFSNFDALAANHVLEGARITLPS